MSNNDFSDQGNKTVLKPRPGSRRPGHRPSREEPRQVSPQLPPRVVRRPAPVQVDHSPRRGLEGRKNVLVSLATPLVTLASSLRNSVSHSDVDSLRQRLVQSLSDFSNSLLQSGYTQETVADSSMRYVPCWMKVY